MANNTRITLNGEEDRELIHRVHSSILERKKEGKYPDGELEILSEPLEKPGASGGAELLKEDYENYQWNLTKDEYIIKSHRPIIGRFLVWGRKLVIDEVKRYIDPIFLKQTEFTWRKLSEIERRIRSLESQSHTGLSDAFNHPGDYYKFNADLGGSDAAIQANIAPLLDIFSGRKNVLDIGCGRGIFLENLRERGIGGYGIDINEEMISLCCQKGLKARQVDAILHLAELNDDNLDGVLISHVVEHLSSKDMVNLIRLVYQKLKVGSPIVIITPNVLNLSVSSNTFFIDPTHINHVHPEVLKFSLSLQGFQDIKELFSQPMPDELKLHEIEVENIAQTEVKRIAEEINANFAKLNDVLFGFMDYIIIAKK